MAQQDESKLSKQFRERDVSRLRNIIQKKFGDATVTQVGYVKTTTDHQEGDIWEENDKTWTIKDGLKQTHTKMDIVKKALSMPLLCPNCHTPMKHTYDKKMYPIHRKCWDCVIKMETLMRLNGTYEEYMRNMVAGNMTGFINDAEDFIHDFVKHSGDIYTEQGDKEEMVGSNKSQMANKWLQELEEMKETLKNKGKIES